MEVREFDIYLKFTNLWQDIIEPNSPKTTDIQEWDIDSRDEYQSPRAVNDIFGYLFIWICGITNVSEIILRLRLRKLLVSVGGDLVLESYLKGNKIESAERVAWKRFPQLCASSIPISVPF